MKLEDITPGYWWWNNGCNEVLVKVYDDGDHRYMTRFGCEPMWLFAACFAIKHFVRRANVS